MVGTAASSGFRKANPDYERQLTDAHSRQSSRIKQGCMVRVMGDSTVNQPTAILLFGTDDHTMLGIYALVLVTQGIHGDMK
ncbi:hypothetical protein N7471_013809 [Penicillium samsonianum]|uniref:uncharacterized protein n=1 Tax=Penicillium samsonianum TaxID=1882272 RepID=UPI0025490E1B|nr:uncharacterized protein N7471_013809 [Penicillium samsonianum]KAJ6118342.1 hypothetical protein N7471_013809 [Penicillium samsonianum]